MLPKVARSYKELVQRPPLASKTVIVLRLYMSQVVNVKKS